MAPHFLGRCVGKRNWQRLQYREQYGCFKSCISLVCYFAGMLWIKWKYCICTLYLYVRIRLHQQIFGGQYQSC